MLQRTRATMGNTEALRPLHSYFLLGGGGPTRNVFLISDGHINAEELTLAAVKDNAPQTRLFTFAVGLVVSSCYCLVVVTVVVPVQSVCSWTHTKAHYTELTELSSISLTQPSLVV